MAIGSIGSVGGLQQPKGKKNKKAKEAAKKPQQPKDGFKSENSKKQREEQPTTSSVDLAKKMMSFAKAKRAMTGETDATQIGVLKGTVDPNLPGYHNMFQS